MSAKDCIIIFDQNEHGTYLAGQIVTGKVIINLLKPKKLKGVKLEICGYAQCSWRDKHGKAVPQQKIRKRRKHVYSGREDYIATTTYLLGSEDSKNFTMDPGNYTYTFACPIPITCPSSFEGTYGHIRYLARVCFIRSGASNRTTNVGFTVLKLLNLNNESKILLSPATNETLENFCFFSTKAVHLRVDLQQTGFVPGQYILVSVHVNNESAADCKRLQILLNLRATYNADTPRLRIATEKMCLARSVCGAVKSYSKRDFAEQIRVPATPPTCEYVTKVVKVTYEICVIAVMNHFMYNPKAVIPITIGNVPLTFDTPVQKIESVTPRNIVNDNDNVPSTSAAATAQSEDDEFEYISDSEDGAEVRNGVEATTSELPPPTYEEAMFMTTNIADDDVNTVSETTNFTPRFPVYDVDSMMMAATVAPPQKPPKRRRRKKVPPTETILKEKPERESPIEI